MSLSLAIEVIPTGTVGAEVKGVDLAAVTGAEVEAIKRAWYEHDVLVFRKQKLTDDDLLAFSRHFPTLHPQLNQGRGRYSPAYHSGAQQTSHVLDRKAEPIGALGDGDAVW